MNLFNSYDLSALPEALICQPACIRSIPPSVEVSDPWSNGGSGIGNGSTALKIALGEYFERRHFYMEVMPEKVGRLTLSLTSVEVLNFIQAFSQTNSNNLTSSHISAHEFNLTQVLRTSDLSTCLIPTACISLSFHKNETENAIYPLRDTCGCSFHWNPQHAILGSIKEQLERQYLAKFWLTKKCIRVLKHLEIQKALTGSGSRQLYNLLCRAGDISVIDISDPDYPGICLLTVYGNTNKTHHVQYCAGMSYSASKEKALEKSIYELWQTYRFIDLFQSTGGNLEEIKDPYLKHFLNCNTYETFREITTVYPSDILQTSPLVDFSLFGLLEALKAQHITGYLYIKTTYKDNKNFFFTKYISPDLFMHMNNSQNINTRNRYSEIFIDQIHSDRQKIMVPFP